MEPEQDEGEQEAKKEEEKVDDELKVFAGGDVEDFLLSTAAAASASLMVSTRPAPLFSKCQFYMVGFGGGTQGEDKENDSAILKNKLSKLIRKERGTILWDISESITHIVVADECVDCLRRAVISFALQLQGSVVVVGPSWLVASFRARQLQPPMRYQPRPRRVEADQRSGAQHQSQRGNAASTGFDDTIIDSSQRKTARRPPPQRRSKDNIFKGAFFAFVRPTPPEWAVDWSVADLSATVTKRGGTILNSGIVNALRKVASSTSADLKSSSALPGNSPQPEKVCYLVSSGGYPQHQNAAFQPLIGEVIKESLCNVALVTPLWIQACVAERRNIPFCNHPYAFQPQSYYISRLPSTVQISVAISGFVGGERTGIRILLEAIGASYTDNMSKSNTHLISKTNEGMKYQKAVEWGLKVVTLNWLKHIIQYGYCGKNGKSQNVGCEKYFSFHDTSSQDETAQKAEQVDEGTGRKPGESTEQESVPGSYASKMSQVSAESSRSGKDAKEQHHREHCGDDMSPLPSNSVSMLALESPTEAHVDKGECQVSKSSESSKNFETLDFPPMPPGKSNMNGRSDSADKITSTQSCHSDPLPSLIKSAVTEATNDTDTNSRKRRNCGGIERIDAGSEIPLPMKPELDSKLLRMKSAAPQERKKKPQDFSQSQVLWYEDLTQQEGNGS